MDEPNSKVLSGARKFDFSDLPGAASGNTAEGIARCLPDNSKKSPFSNRSEITFEIDSDFLALVKRRESCRDYLPDPVPDEALGRCLEALRLAPSACNRQPWRVVVVRDPEIRRRICSEALLPGISMPWLAKAPVLIALATEGGVLTHRIAPLFSGVRYDLLDPGIAGEHLVLAAEAEGLGSCWIGWIRPGRLRKILGMPRSFQVLSLISLGYPAIRRNAAKRKELDEICRFEKWS